MIEIYKQLFNRIAEIEKLPIPSNPLEVLKVGEKAIETLQGYKQWWSEHVTVINKDLEYMTRRAEGSTRDNKVLQSYIIACYTSGDMQTKKHMKLIADQFGIGFESDGIRPHLSIREPRHDID